jgi:ABC-type transport system substrate-binding protein
MLADKWTVSDDSKTYTFELRKGVTFHNGAPLTSDDVQWSINRYLKPALTGADHRKQRWVVRSSHPA